jgi:subtilase family serine protease
VGNRRRTAGWLVAGLAGSMIAAAAAAMPAGASAPAAGRVTLKNSAPSWVAHTAAPNISGSGVPVDVQLFLAPRGGQAALDAAVAAVSTPGSPSYRHFITPAQYRARFEPTDAALTSVTSWLKSNGFTVTGVEGSRRYVSAHGSAAAASKAFDVTLRNYRHNGRTVQAPSADASIPAPVAGLVSGVTGLDNEPHLLKPLAAPAPPPAGFLNARPCSQYYGQVAASFKSNFKTPLPKFHGKTLSYAVCGYAPVQFRIAYGVSSTNLSGAGATIGIVDAYAAPTILKDANTYANHRGDNTFAAGQFAQSNSSAINSQKVCDASGWYGEETLDVEAAHGMAPNANVHYYGAASCFDNDLHNAVARAIDENRVTVLSNSYGEPDEGESAGSLAVDRQLSRQAALQGITLLFSSGDNGDEVAFTGLRQSDSPASNPFVTAVGGTSTAIGPTGSVDFQTGWGTDKYTLSSNGKSWTPNGFLYGAGGGDTALWNRPRYQNGVVPASEGGGRAVPDVALDADPTTGMLVGETQTFADGVSYGEYRIGGTSLASPLMSGMVALSAQHAGGRLGFLNPAIYAGVKSGKGQFTDVKAVHVGDGNVRPDFTNSVTGAGPIIYTVRTFGQDSSLSLGNGWDETTGVGTPNAKFLTTFGG